MAIIKCSCAHKAQDEFHGEKMRVCNKLGKKGSTNEYRCSVCGCPHTGAKSVEAPKDEKVTKKA